MKISRIKIQGFRTIDRGFDCELNDLTLFVGANNSGKSCVVRALDLFFNNGNDSNKFKHHIRVNPKASFQKRYTTLITVWFCELPESLKNKYSKYVNTDHLPVRLRFKPKDNSIEYVLFKNGRPKDTVSDGIIESSIQKDIADCLLLRIIPETRDVRREFLTELGEAFGQLKELVISNAQSKAAKAAKSLQASLHKIFDRELTKRINEHLGEIIPDHSFVLGTIDSESFAKIILEEVFHKYPMCAHSPDGRDFSLEQMGAGFQSNVLIALYRAVANLSGKKLILCVEEPEIHLDPNAQRQTYYEWKKLSSEPNDVEQIIITSHSAFLVNEAQPNEIILVKRDNENRTTTSQLTKDFLASQDIIHLKTKILGIKNTDIFFSSGVILVEGDSDAVAIRGCFEKILKEKPINKRATLSAHGINVIDCGGKKSISPLAKILKQLDVPFVKVYDKDFIQKNAQTDIERSYQKKFADDFKCIEYPPTFKTSLEKIMVRGRQQGYPRAMNKELKKYRMLVLRTEHETDFIDEITAPYVAYNVNYSIPSGEDIHTTVANLKKKHKNALNATGTAMVLESIPDSSNLPKVYKSLCSDIMDLLRLR